MRKVMQCRVWSKKGQLDSLPTGHFAYWTVRLLFGHFAYWTLRLLVKWPPRHFAYRTLRHRTFRLMDSSPAIWTVRLVLHQQRLLFLCLRRQQQAANASCFSVAVQPSIVQLLIVKNLHVMRYLFTLWRDFNETCHQ